MTFYERIKALRKERGLTLEAVGNVVGVGKSTVRKWENGDIKNMGRDKIELLALALGVEPSYLMGWQDEEATDKLKSIGDKLTATSRSKEWRLLSEGLEEMEAKNHDAFKALYAFLTSTYPDTFKERTDDDADDSES